MFARRGFSGAVLGTFTAFSLRYPGDELANEGRSEGRAEGTFVNARCCMRFRTHTGIPTVADCSRGLVPRSHETHSTSAVV